MSNLKQKRFVDTDYFHEQLDSTTVEVEGSHISATETKIGYLKDIEILGNTIQDASNLADIRSVGDKVEGQELYEIPVVSCGKNLFNKIFKAELEKCNIATVSEQGVVTLNGTLSTHYMFNVVIPKGEYRATTFSDSRMALHVFWDGGDSSFQCNRTLSYTEDRTLRCYIASGTYDNHICKFQLEEGTVATPYEPYQGDKLTILSPTQLEKVGDVADRIICKDGVWGVEKNIFEHTFNGSEWWQEGGEGDTTTGITMYATFTKGISNMPVISPNLQSITPPSAHQGKTDFVIIRTNVVVINIDRSKLNSKTFTEWLKENNILIKYATKTPQFIPLPHSQQVKLRTFASKTNISFGCEIEGTIKAQVPKSIGATVNTHTEQINNLNKELDRVKKLEESTVSTVTTESDFTTVEATSNGYFEDVKIEGKTLVNLAKRTRFKTTNAIGDFHIGNFGLHYDFPIDVNKEYTYVINVIKNTSDKALSINDTGSVSDIVFNYIGGVKDGINVFKAKVRKGKTLTSKSYWGTIGLRGATVVGEVEVEVVVLEGDHTQNPPSYFEGLKSVGQSATTSEDGADEIVVSSVKGDGNLFDYTFTTNKAVAGDGSLYTNNSYNASDYVRVIPNCTYIRYGNDDMCPYDKNKNALGQMIIPNQGVFTTNSNTHFVRFNVHNEQVSDFRFNKGIELLDTPHQSDKKRLLYYNEETQTWEKPILREWDSIEKHADGKYYYHQRSGEVVLNGSESSWVQSWHNESTNTCTFEGFVPQPLLKNNQHATSTLLPLIVCDKIKPTPFGNMWQNGSVIDREDAITTYTGNKFVIVISKSKLSTQDVQGFKQWLQANNVTVVYQLAKEKVYECTNIDLITYNGETNFIVESGAIVPRTTLKVHNNISNVVSLLQKKVSLLEAELYNYKVNQNLRQLRTFYKSDYANFGVATVNSTFVAPTSLVITPYGYDLFELFKEIISEGKDCYDRIELEEYIDFYVMTFIFDFEMAFELFDMIDAQHLDSEIEDEPIEDEENSEIIEDEPIDPDFSVDYEEPTIEEDIDVEMGVISEDDLIDIEMGVIPNEDIDVEFSVDVEEEDQTKDEDLEV